MGEYILIISLYRSNTGVFTPGRHQYQPWDSLTLVYYIQVQQHSVISNSIPDLEFLAADVPSR